jgi:hypothetical protein
MRPQNSLSMVLALLIPVALQVPGVAAVEDSSKDLNQAQELVFKGDHLQ